jgi:hypothetical protein
MHTYCEQIDAAVPTQGVVFEIRQGYKSKTANAKMPILTTQRLPGQRAIYPYSPSSQPKLMAILCCAIEITDAAY